MDVAVIEYVAGDVQVVESLGSEDHSHIITSIQQWNRLHEERVARHLHTAEDGLQLTS
jgi:hypothetical protein